MLGGCGSPDAAEVDLTTSAAEPNVPDITVQAEPTSPAETEQPPLENHFADITPEEYAVEPSLYSELFEAESAALSGSAEVSSEREGYSGSGYVRRLTFGGSFNLSVDIPSPQHYNITLRAASDIPVDGELLIDGAAKGIFSLSGSGFEAVRFDNLYLSEGEHSFGVANLSAEADIDCIQIENATEIYRLTYPFGGLSNPNADSSAQSLWALLGSFNGSAILSGQQASRGTNDELERIFEIAGRYPAIRFGELMEYSSGLDSGDIEAALEWANSGGIVGYVWNWAMNGSVYADKSSFSLSRAVTALDIAAMDSEAIALRYNSGDITAETVAVISGIDLVADQLKRLKDAGVAVIFRPLPEASGGQFWWSESRESYLWLYKLIYERMSIYHGLSNLIWVWNGQSADWYVGDGMCDIISLDVYNEKGSPLDGQSGINFMLSARRISSTKPVALSECSALPSPENISADKTYWAFCSTWNGDYGIDGGRAPISDWYSFYNSTAVITRDEIENNR